MNASPFSLPTYLEAPSSQHTLSQFSVMVAPLECLVVMVIPWSLYTSCVSDLPILLWSEMIFIVFSSGMVIFILLVPPITLSSKHTSLSSSRTYISFMAGISLQVVMALHVFSLIFATSILVVMPFSISLLASAAGQPHLIMKSTKSLPFLLTKVPSLTLHFILGLVGVGLGERIGGCLAGGRIRSSGPH